MLKDDRLASLLMNLDITCINNPQKKFDQKFDQKGC